MEYKGFKVGDKVAISDIHGTVCNISESLDKYHIRTERNGVILVGANEMKKLPNYAVGDVVRAGLKILDVTEFNAIENVYYFGNGEPRLPESALRPFDGFRIGDTVWTVKRGKGKVEATNERNRPWFVEFESDMSGCRRPKSENLIPTEAKYKEAMKIGEIVGTYLYEDITHKFSPPPTPDNSFFGKIQIAGCKRLIEELNSYKWPMPKFKKGDAVFYQGKKWEVISVKEVDGNFLLCPGFKYDINRQVRPNGGVCACCVNESDLRLWKETKITHIDNCEPVSKFADPTGVSSEISKMKYIGKHFNGKDMFLQEAGNGKSVLWYGEKGDDIQ